MYSRYTYSLSTLLLVLVSICILIGLYVWGTYNHFRDLQVEAETWMHQIQVEEQRRLDQIGTAAQVLAAQYAHEKEVFGEITKEVESLRGAIQAGEVTPELDRRIGELASQILVFAQKYPQLQTGESTKDLLAQIEGVESRIEYARAKYNRAVEQYNKAASHFPNNWLIRSFGLPPRLEYFESTPEAQSPPDLRGIFTPQP